MKINILNDDDIAILKQIVEEKRRSVIGGRGFGEKLWNPEDDQNTPEVYIALVPSDGIPGLNQVGTAPAEDDEPGYAECEIYQLIDDGVTTPQLKQMDMGTKTVYNISTTTIQGNSEWVLVVKTKTGKWVAVVGGSSSDIVHGIVHQVIGCGYYEVELAEWVGITPENDARYLTGTGTDGECDSCDLFSDTTGTAVADCEVEPTLEEPTSQLSGLGVYVLAFDPQSIYVPLKLNTDCRLVDMGDRNAAPNEASTGTGTSVPTEPVFQIIRGLQTHLILYRERWECCNGVDTLMGRTPVIFAARQCPEELCVNCE